MRVAAFDAKPFERGGPAGAGTSGERGGSRGFRTQLGVGVVISDRDAFQDRFTAKFSELRDAFRIPEHVPFCPSSHLLKYGLPRAISFSDQLVSSVQGLIENLHCFYVILPPSEPDKVRVRGFKSTASQIPTWLFVKSLGPMFSYLTAEDYLYRNKDADVSNVEFHIDGFVSKQTKAWENLVGMVTPKVFWRGDECNPFIACADLMAFLTDVKLRRKRHRLNRDGITNVWGSYTFKTTAHYVNREGISIQAWRNDEPIHVWPYVARPTVFLAMDSLAQVHGAKDANGHGDAGEDPATSGKHGAAQPSPSKILVKSPVYTAAVRYAFDHSASLKFFNRHEDFAHVCDRDVFVYIGPESKRIGQMLHDAASVTVMSGLELRNRA